jgi:hypothetical protein
MAKEKAIANRYDFPVDRYESRYFRYLGNVLETGDSLAEAFKTKDIARIEAAIKNLANKVIRE